MSLSLVSAPVIGFDLVRHPRGAAIADALLLGLSLEPEDLPYFTVESASLGLGQWQARAAETGAELDPGPASEPRAGGRHAVPTQPGVPAQPSVPTLRSVRQTRRRPTDSGDRGSDLPVGDGQILAAANRTAALTPAQQLDEAVDTLLRSMIIDLDILEQLVRRDVLGWCTPGSPYPRGETANRRAVPVSSAHARAAANILVDAIAAEWVDGLDETDPVFAAALRAPLETVRASLPSRVPDVGPCAWAVTQVLEQLETLGPDGCIRLRGVNALIGSGVTTWAAAVHETSWAVMTTGRVHAAATAQLLAVQAFSRSGLTALDGAEGIWNIVSGHLHACVVGDVLAEGTKSLLARSWLSALPN